MARDGAGNMLIPYTSFTAGQKIKSAEVNADFSTIVSELTNSIPRDGQAAPTNNVPFGSYKITGLGTGSAATDSLNLGQAQAQAYIWCGTSGGTKNALTLTPYPAIAAYAAGQTFRFIAALNSDAAATVAVSGLAAKNIYFNGAALSSSITLKQNAVYELVYDGTQFNIICVPNGIATEAFVNPASSLTTPGYIKLSSGIIIQWGGSVNTGIATLVTFPTPFVGLFRHVICTGLSSDLALRGPHVCITAPTATEFYWGAEVNNTVLTTGGSAQIGWIAIGQ